MGFRQTSVSATTRVQLMLISWRVVFIAFLGLINVLTKLTNNFKCTTIQFTCWHLCWRTCCSLHNEAVLDHLPHFHWGKCKKKYHYGYWMSPSLSHLILSCNLLYCSVSILGLTVQFVLIFYVLRIQNAIAIFKSVTYIICT